MGPIEEAAHRLAEERRRLDECARLEAFARLVLAILTNHEDHDSDTMSEIVAAAETHRLCRENEHGMFTHTIQFPEES